MIASLTESQATYVYGCVFVADKHDYLTDAVSKSRCLLAVISSSFIADNYCRFGFQNAVRNAKVDVIYILYGDITSPDDMRLQVLCDEVRIALRNSRRLFVSPLNEDNVRNGDEETVRRKDEFWDRVLSAIPKTRENSAAEEEKKREDGAAERETRPLLS